MSIVSIGPQKRKAAWTIRRLLTAASEETPPRRPPQPAVLRNQSAKPVQARYQPPRRAPVSTRATPPAPDWEWPEDEFSWPHEEFAVIADDEPPSQSAGSRGEQPNWGTPMLDWDDEDAAPRAPEAVSRPAARPRPRPEPAPPRSFHPLPAQGAAPHPAQRRIQETSRRQYREALAEALQREPLPEAERQVEAQHAAQAQPRVSRAKTVRRRDPATEAAHAEAITAALREEAEARARQQYLDKIRLQQADLRARFQYALAELRYEAPPPPLLPQPTPARHASTMAPDQAQQTPPPPQPRAGRNGVSANIVAVAIRSVKRAAVAAGLFSLFINIAALTAPLFMMGAIEFAPDSIAMLLALSGLLAVLYGALTLLDRVRGLIVKRAVVRLDTELGPATCEALQHRLATAKSIPDGPLRDLASLRQFMSGSGPATFLDLPWAPICLLIIFMMHWSLGVIAGIGMLVMAAIAAAAERSTRALLQDGRQASEEATGLAQESSYDIAATTAMETADPIADRWHEARKRADTAMRRAGERMAAFARTSTIVRMALHSVLLGAGALLLIEHEISSGIMIAVSVIGGKALAPVGGAVSQWRGLLGARDAFERLAALHKRYPSRPKPLLLPAPKGTIEVRDLQATLADAEMPVIRQISFALKAGKALGVIGASPAGKSALGRALAGVETPTGGWVRLDGADLRMLNSDERGAKVGYLPQTVELCDGTVGENIARFDQNATQDQIVEAAKKVGIHDMIAGLPGGYDFKVGENGLRLSAAQRQHLGLARAVFGDPVLVVLEEPANPGALAKAALQQTVTTLRQSRTTVILITHRPDALDAVDHLLVLEDGKPRAFGRKSKVLEVLSSKDGKPVSAPSVAARSTTAVSNRTAKIPPVLKAAKRA
jgi:PrtD family type I secretion system ABC transporter